MRHFWLTHASFGDTVATLPFSVTYLFNFPLRHFMFKLEAFITILIEFGENLKS